jgi:prepilin-type N-terminal cleavage/methylation domain-containing protein
MRNLYIKNQQGFTLIEVLVATAIFVMVMAGIITMFNQTLQINRRVQSVRTLVQGTRAFTEIVTREVRNGRIDYSSTDSNCSGSYNQSKNQSLAIVSRDGQKSCFYLVNNQGGKGTLYLSNGSVSDTVFDPKHFHIIPETFRFYVYPKTDPNPGSSGSPPEIQPFVTIVAQFEISGIEPGKTSLINYQTTISTDVYDIQKHEQSS